MVLSGRSVRVHSCVYIFGKRFANRNAVLSNAYPISRAWVVAEWLHAE